MLVFNSQLVSAAEDADIPVPKNPDCFDAMKYPRFELFCKAQLGRPMSPGAQFENAKVIARIPEEALTKATAVDLVGFGWIE